MYMAIQLQKDGQWPIDTVLITVVIPSSCHTPLAFCHVHTPHMLMAAPPTTYQHSPLACAWSIPSFHEHPLFDTQLLPFECARWQQCVHACCMQLWQWVRSVCWTGAFVFTTGDVLHLWVSSAMSLLWDILEGWLGVQVTYYEVQAGLGWATVIVGIVNTKSAENRS